MTKTFEKKLELGYALICEEHGPERLLKNACMAEEVGFKFAMVSDHFHPWISKQGNSPFVWSILGALSQLTKSIHVATGVTCPTIRYHPAIVAQAAATIGVMMPGRFSLGLGTGENLNEHILGERWPDYDLRASMLSEAVKIIRMLWEGDFKTYYGNFFKIDNARIYNLPKQLPEILVAASGLSSAKLAGEIGDGLITTSPKPEIVKSFKSSCINDNASCYGYIAVCYSEDEKKAIKTALEQWPNGGLPGELGQEIKTPKHFEQASELVTEEIIAKEVICGNDPERHIKRIEECLEAGINKVYIHQIGPDQESFLKFYKKEIFPCLIS